jgi:hypothetical protein
VLFSDFFSIFRVASNHPVKGSFARISRAEIPAQERNRGADQCTTTNPVKVALGVFLLPHIWILSTGSIALYLAAVLEIKSAIGINDFESNDWIVGRNEAAGAADARLCKCNAITLQERKPYGCGGFRSRCV